MFLDTRLGNTPRWWVATPKDWNMRIPDEYRECVVFVGRIIGEGSTERRRLIGTAFYVGVTSEEHPGTCYVFLVTARHVAKQLSLGVACPHFVVQPL